MANLLWTDDLATGNRFIDGDHHTLIDKINAVLEAVSKGRAQSVLSDVLVDLIVFTREHFEREEVEMLHMNYPDAEFHMQEHTLLLQRVDNLKKLLDTGENVNATNMFNFLSHWLRNHIVEIDRKLAAAIDQR